MKNLKKILALVLAFACAFTMFAGAAFTDQADIKVENEVVDTLIELGVINGYTDGSFKPNDTVTRAEMAKMIYVLRTGNSDASAYNNDKTSFTDVNGHWAAGFIKYCQSVGIIAGQSATKFAPDQTVTAQEAAKMLLVTLGYDANKAGLVGINWASKTNALADENGLLDDVNTSFTGPCPRQYAAQLIYNAIDTPTVVWRDDAYTNVTLLGDDNKTVGEKFMNLKKTTAVLEDVSKTSGKETFELTLDKTTVDLNKTTDSDNNGAKALYSFTDVKKDYSDLKYQMVTVLYKNNDKSKVYGVYATKDNTQQTGILKNLKMDGVKVKLDGTKYDLAKTTTVYVNGYKINDDIKTFVAKYGDDSSTKYQDAAYMQPTEVKLLATDGSTDYSILNVKTFAVAQVTAVGSDYINVSFKKGDNTIASKSKLESDDWDWYDGIKKDDYVVLTAAGNYGTGNGLVEKATVVTGKVNGTRSDDGVAIGDEWYKMAGKKGTMVTRPNTGANVEMVVVNGYVYYTDTTAGSIDDIALLVEAAPKGGVNSKWEARMIFADGTDKVVEIEKKWDDKDDGKAIAEFHEGIASNPNAKETIGTGNSSTKAQPMLVSYVVSKDVYTLTRLGFKNTDDKNATKIDTNGYDEYVTVGSAKTDGSIKGGTFAPSAVSRLYYESTGVVFVKSKADKANNASTGENADYKVVTGKTASGYDRTLRAAAAVANKSGNSYYAQAAFIDLGKESTGGSSDNYAVVLKNVEKKTGTANGTVYIITAWNGTEQITVTTDDSKAADMSKGDIFSYSATGDTLADIEYSENKQADYYVTAYDDASGDISLYSYDKDTKWTAAGGSKDADKDAYTVVDSKNTVILFVDSDAGKGETGYTMADIDLARTFDSDFWSKGKLPAINDIQISGKDAVDAKDKDNTLTEDAVPNVRVFVDSASDDQITVIVVDVQHDITAW